MRRPLIAVLLAAAALAALTAANFAQDATPDEGWITLFGGNPDDLAKNWTWDAKKGGWQVQDGVLSRAKAADYIWTKETFADFVLELEFNTKGNSGVFFRSDPKDPVHGGFEVQVLNSAGKQNPGKHDAGALYDVIAPKVNAALDGWNQLKIECKGPHMACWLNGKEQWSVDISKWTEAGKNPDGTKNKFKKALGDLPRTGHIGLQDHGAAVSYRNIRIKKIK